MIPIRDTIPSRSVPVATWLLIAANVAVFFYQLTLGPEELARLFYQCGIVPARHTHPEWARLVGLQLDNCWPFLTSMFLHGGWLHLIGNMWTLWIFGDNVEDRMGPARFLVFYLLTGLAAGLTHFITNPGSTVPTVGASGAVAGAMGAYFLLFPFAGIIVLIPVFFWPVFIVLPAFTYILFWFSIQVFGGTMAGLGPQDVGGVAWWAHLGGFGGGVVLHRLFLLPKGKRPRRTERDEFAIEGAWGRRR